MCFLQKQKQSLEITLIIIKSNNRIALFWRGNNLAYFGDLLKITKIKTPNLGISMLVLLTNM